MSVVHRIHEAGEGVGGSPPMACSGDDDGEVLTNEQTLPELHQQLASSDNPVQQGQQDPGAASSPSLDSPPSQHGYGDEEDPPSPRPIVMLDGIFTLNGKSITFPNRPTVEGGEDDYYDDMSSINTDHYHFSYAAPPEGGGPSQPQERPQQRGQVLGQLEPEYRVPLANDDDASGNDKLKKKKQPLSALWYEFHNRTAIADTTTSSSSNNYNNRPIANKKEHGPYANNEKDGQVNGTDDDNSSTTWGCCPECISGAPRWLKMVLFVSVLLLVAAMVMVGVGATMAMEKDREQQQATNNNNNLENNDDDMPSGIDFGSRAPTAVPLSFPSPSSTVPPTALTQGPESSGSATPTVVSVYLTGGRFIDEALIALPDQLASLPYENNDPTTTFLVHLGDWNSPFSTGCDESSYETNVDLFSHSSIPVYFVPGDNEYNDCPNPDEAFSFWETYLLSYETKLWPAPTLWNVTRQEPDFAENFAFLYPTNRDSNNNGVLFVGINLVGGSVQDNREWQDRHEANLEWIDEQYKSNEEDFDVMVVLAHADPLLTSNDNFFQTFFQRVENDYSERQVVLVHRNLGVDSWSLEAEFNGISNLMKVVVEGSIWPPMRMQINTVQGTVDIDQGEWYTL